MADAALIDPTFLFRFEIAIRKHPLKWKPGGVELPEECRLPRLSTLAGTSSHFADVRMAWDDSGLGVWMRAGGKRQLPWCRDSRMEDSDGLHLFLDTRNSPGIHRANRFCHWFAFSPFGGGPKRDEPVAKMLVIPRARQLPNPVTPDSIHVFGKALADGYQLSGMIPADALTGFDPSQFARVSLWYRVLDRELGAQTFTLSEGYPCGEDPSMWGTGTLVQ